MTEDLIVGSATRGVAGTSPSASALVTTFFLSPPRTTIAGVDERFLHRLLFGLIMATVVSGVMATGTALMTLF